MRTGRYSRGWREGEYRKICYHHIPEDCDQSGTAVECVRVTGQVHGEAFWLDVYGLYVTICVSGIDARDPLEVQLKVYVPFYSLNLPAEEVESVRQ